MSTTQTQFTLAEAARKLGLPYAVVWRYANVGRLKTRRVGPFHAVTLKEIERFKSIPRPKGRPRKPTP